MQIFVERPDQKSVDSITNADMMLRHQPGMKADFDRLAQAREMFDATCKGDFKWVASMTISQLDVSEVLEEGFLQDDRKFYSWLDRNPQYCAYDRARGRRR